MSNPLDFNKAGRLIVMTGNPVDGYRFIGPFNVPSEGIIWATDNCVEDWWTCVLESTEGYEP